MIHKNDTEPTSMISTSIRRLIDGYSLLEPHPARLRITFIKMNILHKIIFSIETPNIKKHNDAIICIFILKNYYGKKVG